MILDPDSLLRRVDAGRSVCVNAFGTNFLDYPDSVNVCGDKEVMAHVASQIPVSCLGEPEKRPHLAMAFQGGKNMYANGQTIMISGGYDHKMDHLELT